MRLLISSTTPPSLSFPSFFIPTNSSLSNSTNRLRRRRRCYSAKCTTTTASLSTGDDSFTAKSGYLFDLSATEAETLEDYSISKIATIYYRKPIVVVRRLVQTGIAFGKWFGLRFLDKRFDRADEMFQVRAAELRKILVELGPVCQAGYFIIVGTLFCNVLYPRTRCYFIS